MRNSKFSFFFTAVIFTASTSHAFYPVDGWWYNPSESGRGFNIEMQDDEMFISAFHYRPNGAPVWWVANGRYNDSTGRMSGNFLELENGQCPGCPYAGFPDIIDGAGSPVTIRFDSPVTATLTWDGESISLVRHYWRFSLDDLNSFIFGEFHTTAGAFGIYFGQQFYLDDTFIGTDGNEYVSGRIRGGSSSRLALGRFYSNIGLFVVLIDASPSFYEALVFDMTKDRLEGESETYEKTEDPTGSGLPLIGHRVASKSYVQSGTGPHSQSTQSSADLEPEGLLDQTQARKLGVARLLLDQAFANEKMGVGGQLQYGHSNSSSDRVKAIDDVRKQLEARGFNVR